MKIPIRLPGSPRLRAVFFGTACVLIALGLRAQFLGREIWNVDEGVTFTMAAQVRSGDILYRDAADHRSPLVPYLKAAVFWVAGDWNIYAVHVAVAILLGLCAILLYAMAKRFGDSQTGVASAVIFTALSFTMLDPDDTFSASTGWFLVFFSILGFWVFAAWLENRRWWNALLVGLCFGCSALCKQPGLLDFGVTWVVLALLAFTSSGMRGQYLTAWLWGLAGGGGLALLAVAYQAYHGALHDFLYYAFTYNTRVYVPEIPAPQRWLAMRRPFLLLEERTPALLWAAAIGIGLLLWSTASQLLQRKKQIRPLPWLILGWSATGILSTGLSGREFSHYSAQAIPGLSLAAGWAVSQTVSFARQRRSRAFSIIATAILAIMAGAIVRDCVHRLSVREPLDGNGLFVGKLISEYTRPNDRIFVWGYSAEIYVYAQRLPASRFIYSNFVTGLIPWTNVDPLRDTAYAAVPHAAEQLRDDLRRRPPIMVVDTGSARGYLKYPLNHQQFWQDMLSHYARVSTEASGSRGMRLFRRLSQIPANVPKGVGLRNSAIVVSGYSTLETGQPPGVRINAPSGFRQIDLLSGDRWIASLEHPLAVPVDVVFFPGMIQNGMVHLRLTDAKGTTFDSADFDYAGFLRQAEKDRSTGPMFQLATAKIPPVAWDSTRISPGRSNAAPDTWMVDAPTVLEYPDQPKEHLISFVHGLAPGAIGKSDGYDVVVEHVDPNGHATTISVQRIGGGGPFPQKTRLQLPPRGPGRLVFRFTAGISNDPSYDWIYFGQLKTGADGPPLAIGDRTIAAAIAVSRVDQPMTEYENGKWNAHSPAKAVWEIPDDLAIFEFKYGILDGAYANPSGHTEGITVSVEVSPADGPLQRVYSRDLDPFKNVRDRGTQSAQVALPKGVHRKLALRIDPGAGGDAWDWAWISDLSGQRVGGDGTPLKKSPILASPQK